MEWAVQALVVLRTGVSGMWGYLEMLGLGGIGEVLEMIEVVLGNWLLGGMN